MNFKNKITALILVAAMTAAVLYGSTKEISANESISLFSSGDKETIYFWYSDDTLTDYINSAAVSFGEKEGVRVIPVLASGNGYLEAINKASIEEEQMPDAYIISHDSLEKAYLAGLACEVVDYEGVLDGQYFPQAAISAVTYKGKKIAYPLYYETSVLVYNETYIEEWARQQAEADLTGQDEDEEYAEESDETETSDSEESGEQEIDSEQLEQLKESYLAEAIPDTMDGILSFADTFDAPEGVEGVMEWNVSDILYNYWFIGNYMIVGGEAGDDKDNIDIDNEETAQCLDFYASLNQFFSMDSDNISYDSVVQDFIDGKIIFTIGTTDILKRLEEAKNDGSLVYDYGIATMPEVTEELKSRSMSVTDVVVINSYSAHNELANKFASYLANECADDLYAWTGKVSANGNADQPDALNVFYAEYADSIPLPKMMETGDFWMQLEVLFSKVWNGADASSGLSALAEGIVVNNN
jgi:maltose-binding protein MalE